VRVVCINKVHFFKIKFSIYTEVTRAEIQSTIFQAASHQYTSYVQVFDRFTKNQVATDL